MKVCGQGDCSEYADRGFACAPIYTCKDNRIITDGKVSSPQLSRALISSPVFIRESLTSDVTGTRSSSAVSVTRAQSTSLIRNARRPTRFAARIRTSEPSSVQSSQRNPRDQLKMMTSYWMTGVPVAGMALAESSFPALTIPPWPSRGSSPTCASYTGEAAQLRQLSLIQLLSLLLRVQGGQRIYIGGASLIAPNKLLTVAHKFWVV